MRIHALLVLILLGGLTATAMAAERTAPRMLYDFEDQAEVDELRAKAEHVTCDLVQDNGVTHGRTCCRMVFAQGGGDGVLLLGKGRIADWSGYAAIAFDVFQEREEKWTVNVELWDRASRNYATRCTFSSVVRPGHNSVVVAIDHAKRNSKEGREWSELEEQDKINLKDLAMVKVFLSCPTAGGDLVWWVDNIRLLTTDAVSGPPMAVTLPAGAKAFALGRASAEVPGMTAVPAGTAFTPERGFGIASGMPQAIGKGWPDVLTGHGLGDSSGAPWSFAVALPDGDYRVWLAGGMAIDADAASAHYALQIGGTALYDDHPTLEQLQGEKYLYRFLTPWYSERPNALWLDYIDPMYPTWQSTVSVTGGRLIISATRFWLSALILAPAHEQAAVTAMAEQIRTQRMQVFARTLTLDAQHKPQRRPSDGPGLAYIPDATTTFRPDTGPNDAERARKDFDLQAAPGQRLILRLGLTAFADLGDCKFALSPLSGPATIPASAARLYVQDYRVRGDAVQEACLKPIDHLTAEAGISWGIYAWLAVPADAPAGAYSGTLTMTTGVGTVQTFPVRLTVYPFQLRSDPPFSFGMYYGPPDDAATHNEQLHFMREIGFTATAVPAGQVLGVDGEHVKVRFDEAAYRRVVAAGFGREAHQLQMSSVLGVARRIASAYLGFGKRVDQRPGCELEDPRLKPLYEDYLRQYEAFVRPLGLPVAVEIVDEPREVPNPWNRTLAQTITYADWMKEAGIPNGFVTPMGDAREGKDYTTLIGHAGIISTHAGSGSERLMRGAIAAKSPLWLYNTGMDRLSWGFYLHRVGAVGRWEWHFCSSDGGATQGYPNEGEWYNPFTGNDGFSPHAPKRFPGAMLFKSVYFNVAEGITDATYLATLQAALEHAAQDPKRAAAVAGATALIAELDREIPFLPDVHGLVGENAGALVGQGLRTPAAARCGEWRGRIGAAIIALAP
jgi:hypothetical protein